MSAGAGGGGAAYGPARWTLWMRRWGARLRNWLLLRALPSHRRRVAQSRRLLGTLRAISGEHADARRFAYLREVDPLVVEELVLTALASGGAPVRRNRRYSGDGGSDGEVWLAGRGWCPVQVKRYSEHVSRQHLVEFVALVRRRRARGGLFVHSGRTGKGCYEALRGAPVTLVSGDALMHLLLTGKPPRRALAPDDAARSADAVPEPGGVPVARVALAMLAFTLVLAVLLLWSGGTRAYAAQPPPSGAQRANHER